MPRETGHADAALCGPGGGGFRYQPGEEAGGPWADLSPFSAVGLVASLRCAGPSARLRGGRECEREEKCWIFFFF